jgi:Ca2+-binding RTX toxin-like protein
VFELRNGNEVHFVTAPDLGDGLSALRYALTVQVSDGNGGIDTQSIFVNVTDVKEAITNGDASGTLSGTAGDDLIDGQGGNDTINAGSGYDTIIGGPGGDVVNAGEGDDTIVATIGDGSDIYNGGPGLDTLDMSGITAPVTINLAQSTASSSQTGQDSLNSIENAIGGSGNDLITGNGVDNRLDGGAGNDTINAGSGDDTVIGGAGNDTMNGQGGNDVFVFAAGFGNDQILQFDADPAGGQDRLDLTAFGITNADFAARVTVADVGGNTLITIDGNAAQTILLLGISNRAVSEEDCLLL